MIFRNIGRSLLVLILVTVFWGCSASSGPSPDPTPEPQPIASQTHYVDFIDDHQTTVSRYLQSGSDTLHYAIDEQFDDITIKWINDAMQELDRVIAVDIKRGEDKPQWVRYLLWHYFRNPWADLRKCYLGFGWAFYGDQVWYVPLYTGKRIRFWVKAPWKVPLFPHFEWDNGTWEFDIGFKDRGIFSISFRRS